MTCEACRTIPPVIAEGYETKGAYAELAGVKTYVTGDASTATKAIVDIYDIFGFASQTLQGADALASASGALVLIPDLLDGSYATLEMFTKPEKAADKDAFLAQIRNFSDYTGKLATVIQGAKAQYPNVTGWGGLGLCWGGKIVVLLSGENAALKASAQVHPGMLEAVDAEKLTIPHMVLASNGEDPEVVKQYKAIIDGEGKSGEVETYPTMHHGWMGARSNLSDEANVKEYERGYNQLAQFFFKSL